MTVPLRKVARVGRGRLTLDGQRAASAVQRDSASERLSGGTNVGVGWLLVNCYLTSFARPWE